MDSIRTVDLSLPEEEAAVLVGEALSQHGFFYATNAGLGTSLVEKCLEEIKKFFSLPMEEKLKIEANKAYVGYLKPYTESLEDKSPPDSKECFICFAEGTEENLRLQPKNVWPDQTKLPEFKDTVLKYVESMKTLAFDKLLKLVLLSLGLERAGLDKYGSGQPIACFRPVRYLPVTSDPASGKLACGIHTDYGLVSILTSDDDGLQIKVKGEWIDVPMKENAFVVFTGDMTELLTNGRYKASLHRVLTAGNERHSLVFFFDPNENTKLAPIPELCGHEESKYKERTYYEHATLKLKGAIADCDFEDM